MPHDDALLDLLRRFQDEGVDYVLIGGQAVRLNGFVRATEDIDILLPSSADNGRRVIRALGFLKSSKDLDPAWFEVDPEQPENIRVADNLLIDLLFAANGEDFFSLQPHVRELEVDGVRIRTLDIDGLLKTKTGYRDKDRIDREALERLRQQL
jgi:predicted nucleotidyltransferase